MPHCFLRRSAWGHLRVMCFLYACDGVVRLLIDRGADKNLASNDGGTPLLVASQNGHADVVRLPSEKGATDAARNCGPTALYIACQSGDLEVVRLLSEKFANMDAGRWGLWFFSCMKRSLRFRALVAKTAGASSKPVAQSPGSFARISAKGFHRSGAISELPNSRRNAFSTCAPRGDGFYQF